MKINLKTAKKRNKRKDIKCEIKLFSNTFCLFFFYVSTCLSTCLFCQFVYFFLKLYPISRASMPSQPRSLPFSPPNKPESKILFDLSSCRLFPHCLLSLSFFHPTLQIILTSHAPVQSIHNKSVNEPTSPQTNES